MDQPTILGLLLFIVFITVFVWGLYSQAQRTDELQQHGGRAQGIVVKNKIKWGRIIVVRAIVQFRTEDGHLVEAEDELSTAMAIPKYAKGQQVTVYYDKNNPQSFVVAIPGNFA